MWHMQHQCPWALWEESWASSASCPLCDCLFTSAPKCLQLGCLFSPSRDSVEPQSSWSPPWSPRIGDFCTLQSLYNGLHYPWHFHPQQSVMPHVGCGCQVVFSYSIVFCFSQFLFPYLYQAFLNTRIQKWVLFTIQQMLSEKSLWFEHYAKWPAVSELYRIMCFGGFLWQCFNLLNQSYLGKDFLVFYFVLLFIFRT